MLVVDQLRKKFGSHIVLDGIHLKIHAGETVGVLGASGSGKSTLLRCLNQLEVPTEGSVSIQGVSSLRSQVGMVFQGFNLFSNMSVLENLIYAPVRVKKIERAQAVEKAFVYLRRVGMEHRVSAYPHTLSGGEKQRVALARALMMDPKVILFDEPTSALDPKMVKEVVKILKDLAASGITLVIVSHEMDFIKQVAGRVIYLEQGKVLCDLETKEFFGRSHLRVSGLKH